jgi:ABC-type branched-subunit amino acid transport system ATPase component
LTATIREDPPESALQWRVLDVTYGGVHAVRAASSHVATGEVTCLIGGNGAGKSSLLDALTGIRRAAAGTITLDGRDLTTSSIRDRVQAGIVRLFQYGTGFTGLSIVDSVEVGLPETQLRPFNIPGDRRAKRLRARRLLNAVGFPPDDNRMVSELSFGQRRRVAFASMLAARAKFLLLDEPTAGLDPASIDALHELIAELRTAGRGVLLVEHNLSFVRAIADRVLLMEAGSLVKEVAVDRMLEDDDVQKYLLGVDETEES